MLLLVHLRPFMLSPLVSTKFCEEISHVVVPYNAQLMLIISMPATRNDTRVQVSGCFPYVRIFHAVEEFNCFVNGTSCETGTLHDPCH